MHRAWLERRAKVSGPLRKLLGALNRKHTGILRLEEGLLAQRGAGRVLANSQMVKDEIVKFYGYPEDQIDLVYNGVPLEIFSNAKSRRREQREKLHLREDEVALLFVGSGWERKGLRYAIDAVAACANSKLRLLVAGRGNTARFKTEHVEFLGEINDVAALYAAADIFVLPTLYDPFSNACLEALASGLPVITTRDNGFSEIIEDGIHGSIVDHAGDIDALRAAILFWADAANRNNALPQILDRAAAIRHFEKCRPNPARSASGAESRFRVREDSKNLIEPRDLKDRADVWLQAGERKFSAVSLNVLHSFDQHGESGTVDVTNLAQIDDQLFRLFGNHRCE